MGKQAERIFAERGRHYPYRVEVPAHQAVIWDMRRRLRIDFLAGQFGSHLVFAFRSAEHLELFFARHPHFWHLRASAVKPTSEESKA